MKGGGIIRPRSVRDQNVRGFGEDGVEQEQPGEGLMFWPRPVPSSIRAVLSNFFPLLTHFIFVIPILSRILHVLKDPLVGFSSYLLPATSLLTSPYFPTPLWLVEKF